MCLSCVGIHLKNNSTAVGGCVINTILVLASKDYENENKMIIAVPFL